MQHLTVWQTFLVSGQYGASEGYGRIFCNTQNRYVEGDSMITLPVISPFGMLSVPTKTSNAMGINIGGVQYSPALFGVVVPSDTKETKDPYGTPKEGETVVYSLSYQHRIRNNSVKYNIQNKQMDSEVNVINGEWAAKIIKDLLTQVQDLYQQLETVKAEYSAHTHVADNSPTSTPDNSLNFGTINEDIATDLNAINQEQVYVDDKAIPTGDPE